MRALIVNRDVLDVPADALIYSTNVLLNCSGGVGATLVQRYGPQVQTGLHAILQQRGIRFAERGEVIEWKPEGVPYRAVFHTVPSNGFYETSEEIVAGILAEALAACSERGDVRRVVFSAIATGFGKMDLETFLRVASGVMVRPEIQVLKSATLAIADPFAYRMASDQVRKESLNFELDSDGSPGAF